MWIREDGDCWPTSKYLFDSRIEVSSILSFISCMWVAVIMALNGLLLTARSWRPFIRQIALPGSKLVQMLCSLSMILVFSKATDISYNVRLWARHLAMGTVAAQAFEVLFLLCVGLSYKTWRRGVRDLCGDVSVCLSGAAHTSRAPRSTVIQNNVTMPAQLPSNTKQIPAPHEMRHCVNPEVEMRALKWESRMNGKLQEAEQITGTLPAGLVDDDETPVAAYSTRCKLGSYPGPLQHMFGRTHRHQRPLPVPTTTTQSPPHPDHVLRDVTVTSPPQHQPQVDLDGLLAALQLPEPPTHRHSYNPKSEELLHQTTEPAKVSMRGRVLPPPPPPPSLQLQLPQVPVKISSSVHTEKVKPLRKPRQVRIVERDLSDLPVPKIKKKRTARQPVAS